MALRDVDARQCIFRVDGARTVKKTKASGRMGAMVDGDGEWRMENGEWRMENGDGVTDE